MKYLYYVANKWTVGKGLACLYTVAFVYNVYYCATPLSLATSLTIHVMLTDVRAETSLQLNSTPTVNCGGAAQKLIVLFNL